MVGATISHYKLGLELGHGGMGVVFRAVDSALDRTVAIKFLAPELTSNDIARARFVREAKAAAAIEHPSICSIFEIAKTEDGRTYIVMPYYEGVTLKELIASGRQSPDKALNIGRQVASGLAAAHEKGVVHRDIKPGNIMLTARDRAIILDFGLAKLNSGVDITRSRSSVGTLPYMAPEQLRQEPVDARTDIWGLGTVLYELVSGQRPFQGEYEAAVSYAIINVDPDPLRTICDNLPEGFCDVVGKCLSKNPDNRYQSADELLVALGVSDASPVKVSDAAPVERRMRSLTNRTKIRLRIGLVSLLVLAIGIFIAVRLSRVMYPAEKHLAILEYQVENSLQNDNLQAFSDGLRSALVKKLSRLQTYDASLSMVPMSEFDAPSNLDDARDRYGATHALETVVSESDTGVRFLHRLLDVRGDSPVPLDSLSYPLGAATTAPINAFLSIYSLLKTNLHDQEVLLSAGYSPVPGANTAYLTGLGYLRSQDSEKLDAAVSFMRTAINIDSLFGLAHAGLGAASLLKYDNSKDPEWLTQAIDACNKALEIDETNPEARYTLGTLYRDRGEYEAALREFDMALADDPLNAELHRIRGQVLLPNGKPEEAERSLQRAIQLAPNAWRFYSSLCVHYINTGQFEQALEQCNNGLSLSPDRVSLLNNRGIALNSLDRYAEAIDQFLDLLELAPDYVKARKNLGTAYFYTSQYDLAVSNYSEYLVVRPLDSEARGYLADATSFTEDGREKALQIYREALAGAQEVLDLSGNDPDILANISWYFANLGETDSARVYVELTKDAITRGGITGKTAMGLGETYVVLGDLEQAKTWILQALSSGGTWSRFYLSPWLEGIRADDDFMSRIEVFRN